MAVSRACAALLTMQSCIQHAHCVRACKQKRTNKGFRLFWKKPCCMSQGLASTVKQMLHARLEAWP